MAPYAGLTLTPNDAANFVVVLTTLESVDEAKLLVRELVNQRIVACGTILPGTTSIYRWEGEVADASEVVVLLKTRRDCWDALAEATRRLHPYRVPELIAVPVVAGLDRYLAWVTSETIGSGDRGS